MSFLVDESRTDCLFCCVVTVNHGIHKPTTDNFKNSWLRVRVREG